MIGLPVKPVVVKNGDLLLLPTGQQTRGRLTGKVPFASSFGIDQTQRRNSLLDEEF